MDTSTHAISATTGLTPLAVNLTEAGRLLGGISRRGVERLINHGDLRSFKIGQLRFVRVAEIERYLAEREEAA